MYLKPLRLFLGSLLIVAIGWAMLNPATDRLTAQTTYKLDVKPHLKPLSAIKLDGNRLSRTNVDDDPGFRLQYHIRQMDGKSVNTVEARSNPTLDLPTATNGSFTVVLELFYPAYKGGTSQKGEFKAVSNVLAFKVEAGKITPIELPAPKKEPDPKAKDKK